MKSLKDMLGGENATAPKSNGEDKQKKSPFSQFSKKSGTAAPTKTKTKPAPTKAIQETLNQAKDIEPRETPAISQTSANKATVGQENNDGFTQEELNDWGHNFKVLQDSMQEKEIIGNALNMVLGKLQAQPRYKKILRPEDVGTMVRALRESYGVAVVIKEGNKRTKSAKQQAVDEVAADMDDLVIEI